MSKIPVSVIVVTKNEAANIVRCLGALSDFNEVVVVDSSSEDDTQRIARYLGARVVDFEWNKRYPKKRQWCLDHLKLKHDWVFFVDGDEVLTDELITEISDLFKRVPDCAGYFVRGKYHWQGKLLAHGLVNNKLVLFDRTKIEFPVVDDLDLEGMGEIEGHYQPVLKAESGACKFGKMRHSLIHYAFDDQEGWQARHERYAQWESGMQHGNAWPIDPDKFRNMMKFVFRNVPFRPVIAFVHCYIFKLGFLDGAAGFDFARSRYRYYRMI